MGTLTIRNLDPETHARLRLVAAEHGRSVEAEVRHILADAVEVPRQNLLLDLHWRVQAVEIDGVEIELPARQHEPRTLESA